MKASKPNLLFTVAIITLISFAGCHKDDLFANRYQVPTEVQPYIERFEKDARERGSDINVRNTGLQVTFVDDLAGNAVGMCIKDITPRIELVKQHWDTISDCFKEAIAYHELGHCLLKREHNNELLPNGNRKSVMADSPPATYCMYAPIDKHAYYLDELFDSNTPIPDWAK